MGEFIHRLKTLLFRTPALDASEAEELRNAFKARYHHFKLLLNANNKALEILSEMESLLRGSLPFGMFHVRSLCTTVSTNVWQIIRHLNELAPGKYEALYGRFKDIQIKINPFLRTPSRNSDGKLALPLEEVDKDAADLVGGKMANLGEIKNRAGIRVTNGFVVTTAGFHRFMEHNELQEEINRRILAADKSHMDQLYHLSAELQQTIIRCGLPPELASEISRNYEILERKDGHAVSVALRSSALGEDFAETSFAGQYRSILNVSKENIHEAYKEVVAGKYSLPAMMYRFNRGIRDEDVPMCVGVMSMVNAVAGGVAYSRNPIDIRDNAVFINSVWGLPKTVVDGSGDADLFVISHDAPSIILKKNIPVKKQQFICFPDEGVCRMDITGDKEALPSLTDDQAMEIAGLTIRLEDYYGGPQDVEWAVDSQGTVIILQCRPLKQRKDEFFREKEPEKQTHPEKIIFQGGVTASSGVGAGTVFIAKKDMDVLRFPKGAVLVTSQASPRWASVLTRASAVITEHGSTAGHLANVAREFGVPALFGVHDITRILDQEKLITVDADTQKIYAGRIETLLKVAPPVKNLMEHSPVFEALKGVFQYIVPLNLLDPRSPKFTPQYCMTFHDITRYCHEKVVDEMFRFGKEHRFPERSSKQLYCDVPMQWWVLNLDDGFNEEVRDKYVKLENIVSIPMLALWEGIAAFPWEGPPALDGRGFASVMFEATTNRALTPGLRSSYASRNYFMVSKNYCSLSSRLGFHFSTVEALVSERDSENYINFQFKGGAADFHRRLKRVLFVKEILEEYDFRVEVREDNLIARLEGHAMNFMSDRLKIIGYLTIHTRQLDMIMAKEPSVNYYRTKLSQDIREILGKASSNN